MQYTKLGRSGLKVSRICLGTNMFGAGYVDDARAVSVVDAAQELGVNFIDTADAYNSGLSEQVVGKAAKGRRHDFVIATKGFIATGPGPNDAGLSRRHLIDAVEGSLRRLDTDYIDLYQVHYFDPDTPLEETLRTLDDLVRQGKIRYLGCSNFAAWQLCKALWVSDARGFERFESVQPEYNFAKRDIERELFPLCEDQQVGVIPYQILMGGILTGRYDPKGEAPPDSHMASRHALRARNTYWNEGAFAIVERLKSLAAEVGCEVTQLVIAWALSRPVVTAPIVGASRPEQVAKNAKVVDIALPPEILRKLDALGQALPRALTM
ncbi:MAG: aldo/keto reductase [Chloroflexi bacterium]|nr:aldo/keto reductase [Chloroflexota bacterium]